MSEELLRSLNRISGKYQKDVGIVVWGQIEGAQGTYAKILVKSDGTVKVEGIATISGSVDVTSDWTRQLGQIDLARYLGLAMGVTNPLHTQVVYGGVAIDTRSIRALIKTTDEIYSVLRTDAGVPYDARDRSWNLSSSDVPDLIDKATRLLGKVYGNQDVLQQRAVTKELYVQISHQGVEKDPTQIRALAKATDEVYSVLRTNAGVAYDARDRSWNLGASDIPDLSDRTTRLLGRVYGSQGQPLSQSAVSPYPLFTVPYGNLAQSLQQRPTTYDLLVAIRQAGSELSATNPIFSNITDVIKVVTPTYLAPTSMGSGVSAIIVSAPGVGYKLRLKRLQVSVDTATRIDFRWGTSAFESYYLPANGSVIINKIGENFEGPENTALTILNTGATANVTASASTETLAV